MQGLYRDEEALAVYQRALQLKPDYSDAWNTLGILRADMGQPEAAVEIMHKALQLQPENGKIAANYGRVLYQPKRFAESAEKFEQALALDPEGSYLPGIVLMSNSNICKWQDFAANRQTVLKGVRAGRTVSPAFNFLAFHDDPQAQLECARIYARERYSKQLQPLWKDKP